MALALFGTAKSISDDQIKALELSKVVLLYIGVGLLFVAAAALFYFSKKVPSGIANEPMEKANKALRTLVIMTVLLGVMFTPVFQSYKSAEAKKIETLEYDLNYAKSKKAIEKTKDFTGDEFAVYKENLNTKNTKLTVLKKAIERERMLWLSGALLVVVGGLMFSYASAKKKSEGWGAMQYPQLVLGMLAIFTYVGVEVAIGSNLGELLKLEEFGNLQSSDIAPYISMYWGSLMIGRWAGAISVFNLQGTKK